MTAALEPRKLRLTVTGAIVGLALAATPGRADIAIDLTTVGTYPPLTPNGFNYYQPPGNYTFTFNFTAAAPITVTTLGYYDSALGGVAEPSGFGSHTVTLEDVTTGSTLGSATVTSASPATALFNFAAIAPVTLNTADTYQVQGTTATQYYAVGVNSSAAPVSSYVNYAFGPQDIFGVTGPAGTLDDLGPNFQFLPSGSTCTENIAGRDVIALSGDLCTAAPGAYSPTTTTAALPVAYDGFGFYSHGGTINSPGAVTINTSDPNGTGGSYAVWADAPGSLINLNGATTVTTSGSQSHGLFASGGGQIASTTPLGITTSGDGAFGIYATGAGSLVTATAGATISTSGSNANGAVADTGGQIALTGGSVTTTGPAAWGLYATGAGSQISASGLAVTTSGGEDAGGNVALGAYVLNGATLALTNSTVSTSGPSAHGAEVGSGASATISGGSIGTTGNDAYGLFSTDAGSSLSTSGGTAVSTAGSDAFGAFAYNGGHITLTGGSVFTTGGGSWGIYAQGAGARITATDLALSTSGGLDATGNVALGAYVQAGASVSLTNSTIQTTGQGAHGLEVGGASSATFAGGSISTKGDSAFGVLSTDPGSNVTLTGTDAIATTGDGGIGLLAAKGGQISATGPLFITTTGTNSISSGLSAYGVNADGAGSIVNLAAATIQTSGQGAVGLFASDANATGGGGVINVSGALNVTTGTGPFAYGAYAASPGSQINLAGPSAFTMNGGAYALYATGGGSLSSANSLTIASNGANGGGVEANDAGTTIALKGTTSITLNAGDSAGLFAVGGTITASGRTTIDATAAGEGAIEALGAGSLVSLTAPATITVANGGLALAADGAGARIVLGGSTKITASGSQSAAVQALAGGSILSTGPFQYTASGAAANVGIALSGDNSSFAATGGGFVTSSGTALTFQNGVNQTATFDGFTISNASGDLIFADPSSGTINLANTVANAGNGNLLDVAGGSAIALNANASTLTGAIQTDAASTTGVALTNGSLWTVTGNSTVTSLANNASTIAFAAPANGGFKTLTTGSYVGTGGALTLDVAFGAAGGSDRLIINGGAATGTTRLSFNAIGPLATTTGLGLEVVATANGGTTAPGAFQLANTPAGGFQFALTRDAADQDWYLTATEATTAADVSRSVAALAESRQSQMITSRVLSSILIGANEQVSCSSCGSGFASLGSFALGTHGRWSLTDRLTLLAGFSYDQYGAQGVDVSSAPMVAASLRYDLVDWGRSRPFFEAGAEVAPYELTSYTRSYALGAGTATGSGSTIDRGASAFGRVGWVARLSPIDEFAAYGDIDRSWQQSGAYSEMTGVGNPFAAIYSGGVDSMNTARVGAQYTHLFFSKLEINVNGAIATSFGGTVGVNADVTGFGLVPNPTVNGSTWGEYGARIGYRLSEKLVLDGFVLGTLGPQPAGNTIHGGLGLRYAF